MGYTFIATIFLLRYIMFGNTLPVSRYYFNYIFTCNRFQDQMFPSVNKKYNIKDKYIFYSRYHLKTFSLLFPDLSECLLSKSNKHQNNLGEFSGKPDLPYFDKAASKNVTSPLGKTAYLNCRVKNLANRTVSKQNIF